MRPYWTISDRIMQCLPLFVVESRTYPIQTQFFKIAQNEQRCVKCGRKWTYLAVAEHIVSLWTISGQFTLTWHLDRNVVKPARKRLTWPKLVMQALILPEIIISSHYNIYWTIICHLRPNLYNLASE